MDAFTGFSWCWVFPLLFLAVMIGGCFFMGALRVRCHRMASGCDCEPTRK